MNSSYSSPLPWESGIAILEDNVFQKKALPETSSFAEKRKDPRFIVSVPLRYRVKEKSIQWHDGEPSDVSNTGLRLALRTQVPVGVEMELDVRLPDSSQNVRVQGTIVWVQPSTTTANVYECGVAFNNMKKLTGKDRLLRFITDRLCRFAAKQASKDLSCYPAETLEELKASYRLVYKEYVKRGYCPEHPSQMHYSVYCVFPQSRTFVLKRHNIFLGTLSLIVDSPCGVPMESLFPNLIGKLRSEGRRVAEVSLLALDQETFKKRSFSLTDFEKLTASFRLFKLMFDYARYVAQATDLVIAVHPKHEDLYRYLTFEIMGLPLAYASACGKPALPMRLNIEKTLSELPAKSSLSQFFLKETISHDVLNKYHAWHPNSLKELLFDIHPLWNNLPPAYQQYIKSCYPQL